MTDTVNREQATRKPGAAGVPITLGDGRDWLFPKPKVGLVPVPTETGIGFGEELRRSFGPEYDALVDTYLAASDGVAECAALLKLAVDLLERNYDLTPADFAELLPRWLDDEQNTAMWQSISGVALGRSEAPKPSPGGSDVP